MKVGEKKIENTPEEFLNALTASKFLYVYPTKLKSFGVDGI